MRRFVWHRSFGYYPFLFLSACLHILVVVVRAHSQSCVNTNAISHNINLRVLSWQLSKHVDLSPAISLLSQPTPPAPSQRSRLNPVMSSKVFVRNASNCPRKANAPTVLMGRLASGTYQRSPTWAACSVVKTLSIVTFRSGTCQV